MPAISQHRPSWAPQARIVRIRKGTAIAGGRHHYYHADIIAPNWSAAMKAAREGRVKNWRHVDSFDRSAEAYTYFTVLDTDLAPNSAQDARAAEPAKPGQKWTSAPASVSREPGYRYCFYLPKQPVRLPRARKS
jgi:hypothetical protein